MVARNTLKSCAFAAFLAVSGLAVAQASIGSPDKVRMALGTLDRVVHHTQRLIQANNLSRLSHENGEFKEGAEALEKDIVKEPAVFKSTVDRLLKAALADSQALADAGAKDDAGAANRAHATFENAVNEVIGAFPEDLRPSPAAK